jgi:hypothetical protein
MPRCRGFLYALKCSAGRPRLHCKASFRCRWLFWHFQIEYRVLRTPVEIAISRPTSEPECQTAGASWLRLNAKPAANCSQTPNSVLLPQPHSSCLPRLVIPQDMRNYSTTSFYEAWSCTCLHDEASLAQQLVPVARTGATRMLRASTPYGFPVHRRAWGGEMLLS